MPTNALRDECKRIVNIKMKHLVVVFSIAYNFKNVILLGVLADLLLSSSCTIMGASITLTGI